MWDTLTSDDIVIIPAFGATDEDKKKLVRKGIAVAQYDATCMLVEKVWKAARMFGREGYTVIIHGKAEHEETKATFSNSRRFAPSLIIRNLDGGALHRAAHPGAHRRAEGRVCRAVRRPVALRASTSTATSSASRWSIKPRCS